MEETSEVLKQAMLEGEKTDKKSLVNEIVEVMDYRIMDSQYGGKYGLVQAKHNDSMITFTINSFMLKQLKQIKNESFPIKIKIAQHEQYLRFERVEEE